MAQQTTVTSSQFSLGKSDFFKGFIMAILGAVMGFIQGAIEAGNFEFDWKRIWQLALASAVAYLIKNYFDKPKVVVTDVPPAKIEAIKQGEAEATITPT